MHVLKAVCPVRHRLRDRKAEIFWQLEDPFYERGDPKQQSDQQLDKQKCQDGARSIGSDERYGRLV